eukprot:g26871.t1
MSKRRNEKQITKDDNLDEEESTEAGEWTAADPEKLAKRKIIKAQTRGFDNLSQDDSAAQAAFPRFDFGVDESKDSGGEVEWPSMAPETDDPGKAEKKKEDEWNSGFSWGNEGESSSSATFDWGTDSGDNPFSAATAGTDAFVLTTEAFDTSKLATTSVAESFEGREAEKAGTEKDQTLIRQPARVYILKDPEPEGENKFGSELSSAKTEEDKEDKEGAKKEDTNGASKPQEENAFSKLMPKNQWSCQACDVPNPLSATVCRACETERSTVAEVSSKGEREEASKFEQPTQKTTQAKKFVEIGNGDLYINTYDEEGKMKARMVLRAERTQRLVLNCPVFKDMVHEAQGDKYVKFMSNDLDGKLQLYLLKVGNKAAVTSVLNGIKQALAKIA